MSENAELWCRPDEHSQYIAVTNWLKSHYIKYNPDDSLENLTQLYRDVECGKYKK